jgi:hypothetical protein
MSDDEKKKFFNAVDTAYKAKSEGRLIGYNENINELSAEILKAGTKVKLRGGKTGKVVRYDGKTPGSPFYIVDIGQYYSIEVPADEIKTESVREAELTTGQKKIDVDGDGEIEGSDLAALRAGKKSESVVKESIDTNYWIKYNKNPNGESSQSKKSNNFEYTFKDALNDWNSEGEDVVSGSDAQKIKKLAKEFFDKEGYITYNIVYAMIMQS